LQHSGLFLTFASLKKIIAISLLSIYLISTTELYQLLKLPILIEHYKEHKAKENDLSFLDFLSQHYNQEFAHDKTDNKLPFKSHSNCIAMSAVAFIAQPFAINLPKPNFTEPHPLSVYHKVFFKSSVTSTIWQPPRA
jgi:hypothetical protein